MYRQHRQRFLEQLARTQSAAVIASGRAPRRNGDSDYCFRPESDFYYLTGFGEPDSILVLLPNAKQFKSVLFLREKDRQQEIWNGTRLGVERAPEALGVDSAYSIEDFWTLLPEMLEEHAHLVYDVGHDAERDGEMLELVNGLRADKRRGEVLPTQLTPPDESLHELRLIKDQAEVECMRKAAELAVEAHSLAMQAAAPGKNECELNALIEYTFKRQGSTGPAYDNIVAGGKNACILHYILNDQELKDGELILIDAGAEWNYYASDVTRTFPVNGRFSKDQRALYDVVLAAQRAGIQEVKPGGNASLVGRRSLEVLVDGLLELGLLKGTRKDAIDAGDYRRFYMHGIGHWLGLDVHDCGNYGSKENPRPFEPGMVTTVEPGLYIAEDDQSVEPRWRGIGIRIEDDVLVTQSGNEVLSAALPTDADAIEALCAGAMTLQV